MTENVMRARVKLVLLLLASACQNWPDAAPEPAIDRCKYYPSGIGCPPPEPDPFAALPPLEAQQAAAAAATRVLSTRCGSCHGSEAVANGSVQGGIDYIEDLDRLREGDYLSRCDAGDSWVARVMRAPSARPGHAELTGSRQPNGTEIRTLERYIDKDCAAAVVACNADPTRSCLLELAEATLEKDCGMCHGPRAALERDRNSGSSGLSHLDLRTLIDTGKILPCDSASSRLVQRVLRSEMPPANSDVPAMPDADLELLRTLIDSAEGVCPDLGGAPP